jgi:arylsulfatase
MRTHVKVEHRGISGQDEYSDGMVEHDMHVGEVLKLLNDLGIANETIVQYSTDNGPHYNTWPDAGTMPFRSEKNSNWEDAYRVPAFVRWPGRFLAGETLNGIVAHEDWLPTFAAAGAPDIKDKLLKGVELNGRTQELH